MEHIYPRFQDRCELVKARPETVEFLLNYSKSLNIVKHNEFRFENNLN